LRHGKGQFSKQWFSSESRIHSFLFRMTGYVIAMDSACLSFVRTIAKLTCVLQEVEQALEEIISSVM
jgi:hypothetical protein